MHGPFLHPDGRIYWCHGRKGHEVLDPKTGELVSKNKGARIWSCKPDGSDVQVFAGGGMDNPVEVDFTETGEILGTVNLFHGRPRAAAHGAPRPARPGLAAGGEGIERLEHARSATNALLAQHRGERMLPAVMNEFLSGYASHHLIQVMLRDGHGSPRYEQAMQSVDDLMLAFDHAEQRTPAEELPRLSREGLTEFANIKTVVIR